MNRPKVFIMKGILCSGKSTYAKELSSQYNAYIVSSDETGKSLGYINTPNDQEVFNIMEEKVCSLLQNNKNVIIDSTNLTTKKTDKWVNISKKYNAQSICVFVNPNEEQWQLQMQKNRINLEKLHYRTMQS